MVKTRYTVLLALIGCVGIAATDPGDKYFEIMKNLDIFTSLFKEVNAFYVDEVDPKKLIEKGIAGMLSQLDPYTNYITEEESEAFSIQTTGRYAGIGALVSTIHNKIVITGPYPGFPAYEAGLRVGDELIKINGVDIQNKKFNDASLLLKGQPNTTVTVEVKRAGSEKLLSFTIPRKNITIPNITYQSLIQPNVGFIKLDEFTPGAGKEMQASVEALIKKGATSIILDLRANLGGSLYEAVNVANVFLPRSLNIVSTKGKLDIWNKTYQSLNRPVNTNIPVVVLTSKSTASAAEIVAGSLQDYDRAVLIGQRTFGKGLVQTTIETPYQTQLKITTARYHIPSGRCIQALDYAHRKNNEVAHRLPDSLRRTYKTVANRTVQDGGGITPDILLDELNYSDFLQQIIMSSHGFLFANDYCNSHSMPASLRDFHITDGDYSQFIQHLKNKQWTYTSSVEILTNQVLHQLEDEAEYASLSASLSDLKQKIKSSQDSDMIQHKSEIKQYLEEEIAYHYQLFTGRIDVELRDDAEVKRALSLLANMAEYQQLLRPH